jgi:DNA invertase Pin-like site-specific DNA recombinase
MGKRAGIYCRISRDVEGSGLGVDRQEHECRELCRTHRLDVVAVFTDNDISAYKRRHRPGFVAVQNAMKANEIDVLVAWHPDRLTRQTRELEDLIDLLDATGVDVLTVGAGPYDLHTASGRMQARIVGSVARYESEHKSERLRSKFDELARRGVPSGGRAPYGYRWERKEGGGNLVIDGTEAKHLRWMAKRVLDGWSGLKIERALNERGVPTKEGRPWHHSTVRAVLTNPAVAGLRVHRREIAGPASWKPILDRSEWEQVCAQIADPARKRQRPAQKYVLSGLVESAKGDPMRGHPDRGGRSYSTSQRRNSKGEWINPKKPTSVSADKLEEYVVESALIALRDWKPGRPEAAREDASEVEAIEAELDELARLRGDRKITMSEWLTARDGLESQLAQERAKVGAVLRTARLLGTRDIRKAWEQADVEERRQAVAAVIEKVVVDKATRGRWTTMQERVTIKWRA